MGVVGGRLICHILSYQIVSGFLCSLLVLIVVALLSLASVGVGFMSCE